MIVEALLAITLVSAFVVFMAPDRYAGKLATALSLAPLAGSLLMYAAFNGSGNALLSTGTLAFAEQVRWFEFGQYTLQWYTGVDGVSLPLIVLTTVLTTLALVSSWTPIDDRQSQFYGLVLLMEVSLIGVWGGPRRKYAAIKFLVYTNVASLVMFVGFFALVFGLGDSLTELSLPAVTQALAAGQLGSFAGIEPGVLKLVAFVAMFAGFAVKVPIVPVHTWLPDAHVEAPTPVSVLLAGVLLKMGTYALLRFNFTMLPDVARANAEIIAAFGVLSVIYGAMLALAQRDLKRIVAYSSISSMGYVTLGLVAFTPYGISGATFQMLSHGLISGLMFMVVGVVYNQTHTRMVGDMSGIADRMPWTVGVFVSAAFGYMGLPLMSGFAAEFMIFKGSFASTTIDFAIVFTGLAMFGIVIVAGYLLWAMQRTLFGPYRLETDYDLGPAPAHDVAPLLVLLALVIALGIQPDLANRMIQDAVLPILDIGGGV